jgi:hypothetical protein
MLKPLQLHAYNLAKAMISSENQIFEYVNAHDWLLLSAGINRIEFDIAKYDDCSEYCETAEEYQDGKVDLSAEFLKNLTVFQFILEALESLLTELKLTDVPQLPDNNARVDGLCCYIKHNEKEQYRKLGYERVLDEFKAVAKKHLDYPQFRSDLELRKHVSFYGQGLYIIYRVRNRFAHWGTRVSEVFSHDNSTNCELNLVALSSRILLLTIQMFILAYHADSGLYVDCWWTEEFGEAMDKAPLDIVFSELQMDRSIA